MKRKGFTLIELLAVIVILAIIALIATPIVLDIIDSTKRSSIEATMKNIEQAALLEYSDLALTNEEKEEIIYNCYDGKCTYDGKELIVKGNMPDRGRIIVNKDGAIFENIIIKGYSCIKENNKFICNNTGIATVNGTSILIDNNKTTEIENYIIYGNSIQNGTPTPDTPVEIESVGDLVTLDNCESYGEEACNNIGKYVIPIKVTGKNLWNTNVEYPITWVDHNVLEYDVSTQVYTLNNEAGSTSKSIYRFTTPIPKNTKVTIYMYIIQGNISGTIGFGGYHYDGDKSSWQGAMDLGNYNNIDLSGKVLKREFETTDTVTDLWAFMYTDYKINTPLKFKILYKLGKDDNSNFEPYKETITNIYLDEPLRKVGEYSDYIDFKNKKVVRNVGTMEHTSNLEATRFTDATESGVYRNIIWPSSMKKGINLDGLCTTLSTNKKEWNELIAPSIRFGQVNNVIYIMTPTQMTTDQDLYNYVTNNGKNKSIYYYQLENPIEHSIDLPKLFINKDTSVVSVNTSITPSNIELEYYR